MIEVISQYTEDIDLLEVKVSKGLSAEKTISLLIMAASRVAQNHDIVISDLDILQELSYKTTMEQ